MIFDKNKGLKRKICLKKILLIICISFICIAITLSFFINKQKIKFPEKLFSYTLSETEKNDNNNTLICKKEHTHLKICYIKEISEQDRERVFTCIDLIDKLPSYEEVSKSLEDFENNSDNKGYSQYFTEISNLAKYAYLYYEDLKTEGTNNLQEYVINFDKALALKSMWEATDLGLTDGESPYPVKVNAFNSGDKVALVYGTQTVIEITNTNFTFWQGYLVAKQDNNYVIIGETDPIGQPKGSLIPPVDGFILLFYQDSKWNANINDYVVINFDYKTTTEGTLEIVKPDDFNQNQQKPEVNNNLTPIESVYTKDTIKINLFDYNNQINQKVTNISSNYPVFRRYIPSRIFDITDSRAYSFSENIMTDLGGEVPVVTTGINNNSFGNSSLGDVLEKKLNENGYPVLATGESIGYLFGEEKLDSVKKMNSTDENIDGLFQYDEQTGEYYFDSRKNFAKYNQETNKFELYNEILTPNFIEYPFGNFMPWGDIQIAKKVADINEDYFKTIEKSCYYKFNNTSENDTFKNAYSLLGSSLNNFTLKMNSDPLVANKNWNHIDVLKRYAETLDMKKGYDDNLYNNTELFEKLYNIDYDEKKNFHFGMTMEMRFTAQGEQGDDGKDIEYYFKGDDDVLVYIDDVLFLELAGTHRQVGGNINFTKGIVTYYDFDTEKGDVSDQISPRRGTKTFKQIIEEANGDIELENDKKLVEGSTHVLKFFYLERGAGSSFCKMKFNMVVEPIRGDITGTKTWEGDEGYEEKRPDKITIDLYKNGAFEATTTTSAAEGWKYKFEDLVFSTPSGKKYIYEIKEHEVPNYETTYQKKSDDVINITNTYLLRDVNVNKVWDDNENILGERPDKIDIELIATVNGETYPIGVETVAELNEENNFSKTWKDLPKYVINEDKSKVEIVYQIKEINIPEGYFLKEIKEEKLHTFSIINSKYRNIKIIKIDKANHDIKLENATFVLEKLKNVNGNLEVDEQFEKIEAVTNSLGEIEFKNLEYGEYRITETKAPKGYNKLKEPIQISITNDEIDFIKEVENTAGLKLAVTGGTGNTNTLTYGLIMITASILLYIKNNKTVYISKKNNRLRKNRWNTGVQKISRKGHNRKDRWKIQKVAEVKKARKNRWTM